MFLTLWNYLRGYVIIEISGFSIERFINLAVHKGIYIWDVTKESESARMTVSIKAFKMLRSCAKKTKCKIKIIGKKGFPFFVYRYRKRKLLIFGVVFFICVLFFLSSFIWLVNIEGASRIDRSQITQFLADNGVKQGSFKHNINIRTVEKALILHFKDISWVSLQIRGTKATIRLTETIPKQPIVDKSTPCNIIASRDGVITSIATSSGTPMVKQGDVVQKGDLLVSSELKIGVDETAMTTEHVHAKAEVRAKMYYEFNISVPYEYIVKNYTGNIRKDYSIIIMDNLFNFFKTKNDYTSFDMITTRTQLNFGDDYPLPFLIVREDYKEYTPQTYRHTIDELKEIANKMLMGRILREFDIAADIIDKQITYYEMQDCLELRAIVTTDERIDEEQEIQQKESSPETPENVLETVTE